MKAKTEQLLYELLWITELLMRPTLGKWSESFEGWALRRGFLRQLHELERQAFLERQEQPAGQVVSRIYRLTEKGLLQA
ncbi:MAG: hypothetical protein Q7U75_15135, partial [Desulfobacterales bacterium]|nr:hypothetical protein [Desulfobacterales bacterium]